MASSTIADRLDAVRGRIAQACRAAGRAPESITLVGVGKGIAPAALAQAHAAGLRDFAESYLQEAEPKIKAFAALPHVTWHFVGPIQSNKTAGIAARFDWVHGVDREKVARRLAEQRPASLSPLNVCVQVNVSGEATKAGVAPDGAAALCRAVAALPNLRLRGLMAIPAPLDTPLRGDSGRTDPGPAARAPFRRLRELRDALRREGFELDTLSAGMSDDFEAAIAEGSTMVRVGTAIFGKRG